MEIPIFYLANAVPPISASRSKKTEAPSSPYQEIGSADDRWESLEDGAQVSISGLIQSFNEDYLTIAFPDFSHILVQTDRLYEPFERKTYINHVVTVIAERDIDGLMLCQMTRTGSDVSQ